VIYLDNNATTQPSEEVIDAMGRAGRDAYINPSSIAGSMLGMDRIRIEAAAAMRELLNAEDIEGFYFTSGATESNNWVMGPIARSMSCRTIIISDIEHPSVTEASAALAREGFRLIKARVAGDGRLDLNNLARLLDDNVAIVSVMAANNETGVIQPIQEIGRIIRERSPGAIFHTDATQAIGKSSVDLQHDWGDVDLLSFSAHKFHGPKGVGGLYVRPGISIPPFIVGGGQEEGLRSGTTNTPALAGLTIAAKQAMTSTGNEVAGIRDAFEAALTEKLPSAIVHSYQAPRLANTSCFSIPAGNAGEVVAALAAKGIIVGTGSACSAGAAEPPHTLLRMGVNYEVAAAALRVSLSRYNSMRDVQTLLEALATYVARRSPDETASAVAV
jgi:cysteine desulfurase